MRRYLALCLLPAVLAATPAAAQETEPRDVFGEVIEVRVVNLETVVSDRSGQRVTGLAREDFRLLVDGREVPIDYFSEIRERRGVEAPQSGARGAVGAPGAGPAAGEAAPVNFLVFVDDVFAIGAHRNVVLRSLDRQLAALGPADRVAVVAFDGGRLELLSGWTGSLAEIESALERASNRKAQGAMRQRERRFFSGSPSSLEGFADQLEAQLENVLDAASASMRALKTSSGRNVMLLLSGGWPYELILSGSYLRPFRRDFGPFDEGDDVESIVRGERSLSFGRLARFQRGAALYQPLVDTANLLGYTLYPVDVPGLSASGPGVEAGSPGGPLSGLADESGIESSLLYLARETGGRALLNTLRTRALERAVEDTGSYYWLGFNADRRSDNRRHQVRVEVRRPDLEVRSRRDYVDFSRGAEVEMLVEGSLLFGESTRSDAFPVRVGEARRVERRRMEVPVSIEIPVDGVTPLHTGEGYVAHLELSLGVKDSRSTLSEIQTLPIRMTFQERPMPGVSRTWETVLTLWREPHDLVVSLHDLATGRVLTSAARVEP